MVEEDLKNNILIESGSSIHIFSNTQLVMDIKKINKLIHLSTNVVSKIN